MMVLMEFLYFLFELRLKNHERSNAVVVSYSISRTARFNLRCNYSVPCSINPASYELLIICLRGRTRNSIHWIHTLANAANADQVARSLNRFSDSAFLSECDRAAVTDLVEDFFCSRLDEQEEGKQKFINCNSTQQSISILARNRVCRRSSG